MNPSKIKNGRIGRSSSEKQRNFQRNSGIVNHQKKNKAKAIRIGDDSELKNLSGTSATENLMPTRL
eukprot:scaffold3_cov273-Pinguiococcus_pyrenoidosus.AAC.1